MFERHPLRGRSAGLAILAGVLAGCNSTAPVAETPPPPVSVSKPVFREVIDYDDYEGRIAGLKVVDIRARVRGHLVKVNFEDGKMVKEGDLLFEIDPRPYQAQLDIAKAQVKQAQAQLAFRKNDLARNLEVAKTPGAISQKVVDLSESAVKEGEANVLASEAKQVAAQLDLDYTRVLAPISGKIGRSQVDVGNLVNAGGGETLLATIVTVDPMYVYFDVPERAMLHYRKEFGKGKTDDNDTQLTIKALKIPIEVALEGEKGFPHKGILDFSDNRVNPSTGTIQVRGVLPNSQGVMDPGMRARILVPVTEPHKALLLTERAVGTDQGRKFIYVVNDQNVVERRDIQLGRLNHGLQVVLEGVKPEDRIIVNGIQRVRDGIKVEPRDVAMPGAQAEPINQTSKN